MAGQAYLGVPDNLVANPMTPTVRTWQALPHSAQAPNRTPPSWSCRPPMTIIRRPLGRSSRRSSGMHRPHASAGGMLARMSPPLQDAWAGSRLRNRVAATDQNPLAVVEGFVQWDLAREALSPDSPRRPGLVHVPVRAGRAVCLWLPRPRSYSGRQLHGVLLWPYDTSVWQPCDWCARHDPS